MTTVAVVVLSILVVPSFRLRNIVRKKNGDVDAESHADGFHFGNGEIRIAIDFTHDRGFRGVDNLCDILICNGSGCEKSLQPDIRRVFSLHSACTSFI